MDKNDLVEIIAEKAKLSKDVANDVLDYFFAAIGESLKKNETVTLLGFGTFDVSIRKERDLYNPRSKKMMRVQVSRTPKFKPGKALRVAVADPPKIRLNAKNRPKQLGSESK